MAGWVGSSGGGWTATAESQRRQYSAFQQLPPDQQAAILRNIAGSNFQAAPQEDSESLFGKIVPNIVEKTVSQVADALIHTPGGLYTMVRAMGHDAINPDGGLVGMASRGDTNPFDNGHTGPLVEGMGRAMLEDVKHPLRNPGYLLLDAASVASLGAGSVARVGAAGRVARAGMAARRLPRTPPDTPVAIPRPSPVGPVPTAEGLTRAPSDILAADKTPPAAHATLSKGLAYEVKGPQGRSFTAHYERTIGEDAQATHYFRTPEGKTQQIKADRVEGLTLKSKIEAEFPGERLSMHNLPEGELPPRAKRAPKEKPPEFVPEVRGDFVSRLTKTGKTYWIDTKTGKRAKEPPRDMPSAADIENEAMTEKPVTVAPAAEEVAAEKAMPKSALTPEVEARAVVKPQFEQVPREPGLHANVGEGRRVSVVPTIGTKHKIELREGGKVTHSHEYPSAASAMRAAHSFALKELNKPKGGAVPTRMEVARDVGHALLTKPAPGTRSVEHFVPEPAKYDSPETARAAEAGQQEMFAAEHPPEPTNLVERKVTRQEDKAAQKRGERVQDTGQIKQADVLLSRNPGVALAQNIWIDFLESFPELRVGPWGRDMRRYVEFNAKEADRARAGLIAAREAGLNKEIDELDKAVEKHGAGSEQVFKVLDSMNTTAKVWLLYLKPGYYVANLLGQELIHLADHAWSPGSVAKSVRIQWEMYGKDPKLGSVRAIAIRKAMGESGVSLAFGDEHGLGLMRKAREKFIPDKTIRGRQLQNVASYDTLSKFSNKILDTPFRDNAFITEARRHGYTNADKIGKLIDDAIAGDAAAEARFLEIARRANRNIIDYGRLGTTEKRWIRRIMFFYPWFKGASIYTAHFAADHPLQGLIAARLGYQGKQTADKELGPVPGFLEGVFKVGERDIPGLGKMPLIVNPKAVTVLGTPGELMNVASAGIGGGGDPSTQISQYLTPALSASIAAMTHRDPFTGAEIDPKQGIPDIFIDQLKGTLSPLKAIEQVGRAHEIEASGRQADVLLPYSGTDVLMRYGLSATPMPLNTREARSRAFAEESSLASRRQREMLKNKDYRDRYLEAGRSTKLFAQMPPELTQAFSSRANLAAEVAAAEANLDHPMTMIERLQATVGVLVRSGKMEADQARALLQQMAQLSDSQVEAYKAKLTNAYFGGEVISRYRAALNASGAGLTVP